MSNLKMNFIMDLFKTSLIFLGNLSSAYSGSFKTSSLEIKSFAKEMKNIDIPTARLDKKNLKQDCNNVVSDYKKSFAKTKNNG